MKNKPKYLVSVYLSENTYFSEDDTQFYKIVVADIDRDIIIQSVYQEYIKEDFKEDLERVVREDCVIIFNNENMLLTRFLVENYKDKLLKTSTILNRRIYGWTPSKNNIDNFYLKSEQDNIVKETIGAINYYLDKGYGRT